jgi:hypothetical protein
MLAAVTLQCVKIDLNTMFSRYCFHDVHCVGGAREAQLV